MPDAVGDEASLYATELGGTDFAFTGDEPQLIFRDASVGDLYAVNDPPGGAVYDVTGTNVTPAVFDSDPTTGPTFGSINPTVVPIVSAGLISEFEPNPFGDDPSDVSFELSGTPGEAFSGWILSVESDGNNGLVDRAAQVSGTFDSSGLLVVEVPDLENPSFTVILTDAFSGAAGSTDIDSDNDGEADALDDLGNVLDAIGVPDAVGDEASLYATELGGTDFAFTGDEPQLIFRDASVGDLYAVNDPAGGAVFDVTGTDVTPAIFDSDPTTGPTFGSINPTVVGASAPELLLTELVVTPTGGEFIEIYNPGSSAVDLSDVYLTDATFAGGSTYYYNIVTGSNAGGGGFSDFFARFPDGASIAAGEYQTVALAGSTDFFTAYGVNPTYELYEDDVSADAIADMREALAGSINSQGGLTNGGEVAVLFTWDGASDLVTDLDYAIWGDTAEAVDKTGISIDGPDADTDTSTYLNDTALASQDLIAASAHAGGSSWQREDLTEGTEIKTGGNGANGHNETSENLSATWCESETPTPNGASQCPVPDVTAFINELRQAGSGISDFFELQGTPGTDLTGLTLLEISGEFAPGKIDSVTSLDGTSIPADGFFLARGDASADLNVSLSFFGSPKTYLLVTGFTGADGNDLDTNDDGTLDSSPWAEIVDAVSLIDGDDTPDFSYSATVIGPQTGSTDFAPAGIYRCGDAPSGSFSNDNQLIFNDAVNDTPGESNAGSCLPSVFINELRVSGSTDAEFFEIQGEPGTSLAGLTYLAISGEFDPGQIDNATDLSALTIPADGFLVVADSTAAAAYGITPDLTVDLGFFAPSTHLLVSGFTGAQGDDLEADGSEDGVLDSTPWDAIIDSVSLIDGDDDPDFSYSAVVIGPDGNFAPAGVFRCVDAPSGTFSNSNILSFGTLDGTPGTANDCVVEATKIHAVQGTGENVAITSPVTVEGIVVGSYQGTNELDGFFLQEEDADADADPNSSEGIFIYCGIGNVNCPTVAEGDQVEVTGTPTDFFDMSQIVVTAIDIVSSGNPLPTPVTVSLPASGDTTATGTFENVEGMLVTFDTQLTVTEFFQMGRYGQVVLSEGGRLQQYTNVNLPDATGYATYLDEIAKRRIILDDRNNEQNQLIDVFHPQPGGLSTTNFIRGGYTVDNMTGVMHYSFAGQSGTEAWRVRPTESNPVGFTPDKARPVAADIDAALGTNDIKVATLNVLNFFTTVDVTASTSSGDCGPSGTLDCRGADSQAELDRQAKKLGLALAAIDADVVGLVEIENNATASLQAAVDAVNAELGSTEYAFVNTGAIGTDAIKVGFIYKTSTLGLSGSTAVLDTTDFTNPFNASTPKNRPAVAQTFEVVDSSLGSFGEEFIAVVNHLKSKGSDCGAGDDDTTTGQGNCNGTRTQAAAVLVDWLATDPTGSGDPDIMILGDINAYAMEDPIMAIKAGPDDTAGTADDYTDLIFDFNGASAFSFVFDGQWGYLDHALANSSMAGQVTGVYEWPINSEEINLFDYNDDVLDAGEQSFEEEPGPPDSDNVLFAEDVYRVSDHDPVIVGLVLGDQTASAQLVGTIQLEGPPAPPDPTQAVTLMVKLYAQGSPSSTPAFSFTPTTDQNGSFTVTDIDPGTYEVEVKYSKSLQVVKTVTLAAGSNSEDFGLLLTGDANNDNEVMLLDFSTLSNTFNTEEGDPTYDDRADFNEDGKITLLDFSLLAGNFNLAGEAVVLAID
ncbi:MAG: ExeM/NucH family extracellular endonuclease [Chloroflexota bacterium]